MLIIKKRIKNGKKNKVKKINISSWHFGKLIKLT